MLTEQILKNEITVEQAQFALLSYYRRVKPPTLEEVERNAILDAMERNADNLRAAAEELDVSRNTLYRKLRQINALEYHHEPE